MNHFSRLGTLTFIASGVIFSPFANGAGIDLVPAANATGLLLSSSSQGYLGVGVHDVDNERAPALKLKEARGAEITSIDHDAPAAKSGLKVHDVVVQMNGQRIEGIEQFRRMLRETPPGRTVSLVAMRDGQTVNISVQLADRAAIASQIIDGLQSDPPPVLGKEDAASSLTLPGNGNRAPSRSNSFFGSLMRSRYYVGVELQPLPTGLADYFGAKNGVLVGNVFPNSPAAAAGLKAADVIQKVNGQPIVSLADWEKAIRLNHGKPVQVTVIRDKTEQNLTMVAGEARNSSELEIRGLDSPEGEMLAEMDGDFKGLEAQALADRISESMKGIDVEALRKEAEQAAKGIDTKALEKALEANRQYMKQNGERIERQMEELKQSLQSFQFEQMD